MMKGPSMMLRTLSLAVVLLIASGARAETPPAADSGLATGSIKALSTEDVDGYLGGKGMGFAKAAELNGFAGPSHVLPTGGTARFASGLNANDFRRRTSVLRFTKNGMRDMAEDVVTLANIEGLVGHAASIELRANDNGPAARPKPKPEKAGAATPAPLKK